jgi:hypothetical protein
MYEKVHQWYTVHQAVLQINMEEKQNYPKTFRECCKSKLHNIYTGWSKSLCAPDDYNTRLSCLITWLHLTAWKPTARARGTLDSH